MSSLGMEGSSQERAGVNVNFRDLWLWIDEQDKYRVGHLFTWCLVPGTNQLL